MLFNWKLFPGTNLQDINLDWIINFVKMIPSRLPKFSDHHTWLVYDYSTGEYYDSGEPTGGAGEPGEPGKSPIIGTNGNWYTWNTETETYTDTGTKAQGVQGEPGAGVASGGVAGDVLVKASGVDYDTGWTTTPPQMGTIAPIETRIAQAYHASGSYLVYNGKLYHVDTAISQNDTLTPGVNITEYVISNSLISTTYTLSADSMQLPNGVTLAGSNYYVQIGRIVLLNINLSLNTGSTGSVRITNYITNPNSYPQEFVYGTLGNGTTDGMTQGVTLRNDGSLDIYVFKSTQTYAQGTITYIAKDVLL